MAVVNPVPSMFGLDMFERFASKFGYNEEDIDTGIAVLETITEILEKKARPHIFEWEKVGAQVTEDGKVKLPDTMQAVIDEIIKDNQFYGFFIPQEQGGFGFNNIFQTAASEVFTRFDISLQISIFITLSVMEGVLHNYKNSYEDLVQEVMQGEHTGYVAFTEPQAGSNLENVKSTSELDGDEYVLNGTKIFISNGGHADIGLFLAKNMVNGKAEGTNVLLVDTMEGLTCERVEEKSGLKANPTGQLHFDNVRVPKENVLGKPGEGYHKVLERLMGMRLGVAAQAIGASMRAYELAQTYAQERVQFRKPIAEFDGVRRKLKAMEQTIPKMREYAYRAAYGLDRFSKGWVPMDVGAKNKNALEITAAKMLPSPIRNGLAHYQVSSAKMYNSEVAQHILYDAQQIFGGAGFVKEYEVNKITRDIRVLSIYEGTSEIHEFILGKSRAAVNMVPTFKPVSRDFEDNVYDQLFYARFPTMKELMS